MEYVERYLIMLNQHGEVNEPGPHYSFGGNLLSSRRTVPPKLRLSLDELEDFLLILGKPLGEQALIFRIDARDKRYSFTAFLSKDAVIELGWWSDDVELK